MAGDVVSAASRHYGGIIVYALPHELDALRQADVQTARLGPLPPPALRTAATLALAGRLFDSHRIGNFTEPLAPSERGNTVLHAPLARTADPEDLRRIHAYRSDVRELADAMTWVVGGIPARALEQLDPLRGIDPPGAPAQRQQEAQGYQERPFNPHLLRTQAPAHDGSPAPHAPAFHARSPLERQLDSLLSADHDHFLQINRELAAQAAGQTLLRQAQAECGQQLHGNMPCQQQEPTHELSQQMLHGLER